MVDILAAMRPEDRDGLTESDRRGFRAFSEGFPLNCVPAPWVGGWWRAWSLAYAMGVKASILDGLEDREGVSPFPQFSGAWEAWAEGYDSQVHLPYTPGDAFSDPDSIPNTLTDQDRDDLAAIRAAMDAKEANGC